MLNLTVHKLGGNMIFHCVGRLVSGDVERLRDAVLSHSHARLLVLDLAAVENIDAAGLGLLVSLRATAENSGAALKLMNVNPRVERLLEITQLKSAFEICSVAEMFDLLCEAIRAKPEAGDTIEMPQRLNAYARGLTIATGRDAG